MDLLTGLTSWFEVDLDAISRNFHRVRGIVGPPTKIMAMVKADAAGHGAVETSKVLLEDGVDMLGVATLSEAIELRRAGIRAPILIATGGLPGQAELLVRNRLSPTVVNIETARALSGVASALGVNVKVHVKVDTGMGRWGVRAEETPAFVAALLSLPGLEVEGLFTHFASADEEDPSYTESQFQRFLQAANAIESNGFRIPIKHVAASAAILNFPHMYLDMVRTSSLLHGLYPSKYVNKRISIEPTYSVKSRVAQLKKMVPGDAVSYGRTFVVAKPSLIAVVPFGFTDGLNRVLSNQWHLLIRAKRAPIIGRICMDACMVDVTEIPDVSLGDEVVIIGRQGDEVITPADIAAKTGATQAGLLSQINKRVPRVYLKGGAIYKVSVSLGQWSLEG